MYYVYQNTMENSKVVGQFDTKDEAISYMEHKAMTLSDIYTTGFAVRDYAKQIITEWEV
jgi:hypothetical protein